MQYLLDFGLLLFAMVCTAGVFYQKYDDELFQRVGLCITAAGTFLLVYARVNEYGIQTETQIRVVNLIGMLIFSIATAFKVWKQK